MKKYKVLIITNPLNHEGGIVNYYNLFFKSFKSESILLNHSSIGSRAYLFYQPFLKSLLYPVFYLFDITKYLFRIISDKEIRIIQLNPSLIPLPLIRDSLIIMIGKLFKKRIIVFYRGWKIPTYKSIQSKFYLKSIFNYTFQRNTQQIVLAESFKKNLKSLYPQNSKDIIVTTTAINKQNIIFNTNKQKNSTIKVLFLGRIETLKGMDEIIESIIYLKKIGKLNRFQFSIVGHEYKIGYVKSLIEKLKSNGIGEEQVTFKGRIVGEEKYKIYSENDIFLLPSYSEGCPNSVLEALASGLFCITSSVGALSDLIIPLKNGLLIQDKNILDIVESLDYVYNNPYYNNLRDKNSREYSKLYDIGTITSEFEKIYRELL